MPGLRTSSERGDEVTNETSVEIQETRYRAVLSETTATWKCGPECGLYYQMGCYAVRCRKDLRGDGMFAHWVCVAHDRASGPAAKGEGEG